MKPRYSIVAPIYNEEGNIPRLYERITTVMDGIGEPWELICVNDGSRDNSLAMLEELTQRDARIKLVNFARNFGHQIAVTAGLHYTTGDAVVIIDSDLQDPPELIADMVAKWKDGYEVVYAVRRERKGESWFKLVTAKLFYRLIYRITDVNIPLDTGDFRLMDRAVVDVLNSMPEHNRFIRGMTSWVGFRQTGVEYDRDERGWGQTNYPLPKMIRFAFDAITGFSYFPLQVMIYVSLVLGFLALITIFVISFLRLYFGPDFFGGQATTIVLLLLVGSFQLFFLFMMGQYVSRIYDEVRGRPLYVVAKAAGFDDNKPKPANRGEAKVGIEAVSTPDRVDRE